MTPARWPRGEALDQRVVWIDPRGGTWRHGRAIDLSSWLRSGDLLVVNDAATVPASLAATGGLPDGTPRQGRGQHQVEIRLAADLGGSRWRAVLFGAGDWRTRTEDRSPPPTPRSGDELRIAADLVATVDAVDARAPRLVTLRFSASGTALWSALYRYGRPVQYAHLAGPLELWHTQTPFATRPWAVEMPSAGRAFTWGLLDQLRRSDVRVAPVTHAAGLSSTGDPVIDAALPLPERFDVPLDTVRAIARAHAEGGRVVAIGTTVVRALEGCAASHGGELQSGEGTTDLHVDARFRPRVVDGVLSGLHDVGSSHRDLLEAFAPGPLLARALADADARGYLSHEFGDTCLVLPGPGASRTSGRGGESGDA